MKFAFVRVTVMSVFASAMPCLNAERFDARCRKVVAQGEPRFSAAREDIGRGGDHGVAFGFAKESLRAIVEKAVAEVAENMLSDARLARGSRGRGLAAPPALFGGEGETPRGTGQIPLFEPEHEWGGKRVRRG